MDSLSSFAALYALNLASFGSAAQQARQRSKLLRGRFPPHPGHIGHFSLLLASLLRATPSSYPCNGDEAGEEEAEGGEAFHLVVLLVTVLPFRRVEVLGEIDYRVHDPERCEYCGGPVELAENKPGSVYVHGPADLKWAAEYGITKEGWYRTLSNNWQCKRDPDHYGPIALATTT